MNFLNTTDTAQSRLREQPGYKLKELDTLTTTTTKINLVRVGTILQTLQNYSL